MSRILFISNWPFSDGLTQSTVLPNLKVLAESEKQECVVYTSLEFTAQQPAVPDPKIIHHPFSMKPGRFVLLDRFLRWKRYGKFLDKLIKEYPITTIIARGAPAGIIASKLAAKHKIPYYVESFEPHSAYMEESGVWRKWDPRYIRQKWGEKQVKRSATGIITVSENYRQQLIAEKLDAARIRVVPCVTDTGLFIFDEGNRHVLRQQLGIPQNAVVGINVGKYGGIYHDHTAFALFDFFFKNIPGYYQLLLTPDPQQAKAFFKEYSLPADRCFIDKVPHKEIPGYLSAADFGFVLVKTTPAKKFCSAIKTGEYWACGLPVIITEGIGDESDIIQQSNAGIVWDAQPASMSNLVSGITNLLNDSGIRSKNRELAIRYRQSNLIKEIYTYFDLV